LLLREGIAPFDAGILAGEQPIREWKTESRPVGQVTLTWWWHNSSHRPIWIRGCSGAKRRPCRRTSPGLSVRSH